MKKNTRRERVNGEIHARGATVVNNHCADQFARNAEYRALVDNLTDFIYMVDPQMKILALNKSAAAFWQCTPEKIISKSLFDIFPQHTAAQYAHNLNRVFETGTPLTIESRISNPRRELITEVLFSPIKDSSGTTTAVMCVSRDITHNKHMELLIKQQLNIALTLSSVQDLQTGLDCCLESVISVSRMECGTIHLISEMPRVLVLKWYQALPEHAVARGSRIPLDSDFGKHALSATPIYGTFAELARALPWFDNEEKARAVAIIPILSKQRVIGCFSIASRTREEVPSFCRNTVEMIVAQMGNAIARLEAEAKLHDAHSKLEQKVAERTAQLSAINQKLHTEITARKRTQKKLVKSERFLQNVFDGIQDGISILNTDLTIQRANSWMTQRYQEQAPFIGKPCYQVYQLRDAACPWCPSIQTLKTGTQHNATVPYPSERNPERWLDVSAYPLRNTRGKVIGIIEHVRDITVRRRAEQTQERLYSELKTSQAQLIRLERLKTMGMMAAGVAHELNNPMMGMINFVQYCMKHTPPNDRIYPILFDLERETRRCIDIVQRLLTFAHAAKPKKETMQREDISLVLDRVIRLLDYRIKEMQTSITRRVAEDVPKVWIRVSEIQQVFLNILTNALDAVEKTGRKKINIAIKTHNGYVSISVKDTGCGIAPEHLEHVFDPFFSTKGRRQGTGLGLAISQNIIKEHGGKIMCKSSTGGTEMCILLPQKITKKEGQT